MRTIPRIIAAFLMMILSFSSIACNVVKPGEAAGTDVPETTLPNEESTITLATNTIAKTASAGIKHIAVIMSDGTLYTWGCNEYGQLGNGTTKDSSIPIKVLDDVVRVYCGDWHTVALKNDGSLWAWGYNAHGQVGNGGKYNDIDALNNYNVVWNTPVKVLDGVIDFCCENVCTTALTEDGSVYVWGAVDDVRYEGELISGYVTVPTKVATGAKKLAGTNSYITESGELYVYGSNFYGAVGINALGDCIVPEKVLDNVVYAHTTLNFSFAIKGDGTLFGWGNCKYFVFGTDDIGDRKTPYGTLQLTPKQIASDVISVTQGESHTAMIKSDHSLHICGANINGCIGNNMGGEQFADDFDVYTAVKTPVKVLDNIAFTCDNYSGVLAVTRNGALYIWGKLPLGNGEVGNYPTETYSYDYIQTVPFEVLSEGSVLIP